MTMDNGEGRPLDETEAGNEDPQGWYFDLPGGAWERQEEKNRTLRQRVLGNITEDEARAKSDPFGGRAPEPDKKGGRGFFGRRKKEDDETPRTSAGGTWVLNAGQGEASPDRDVPESPDLDDEEWTTEPPLQLAAFQRLERRDRPEWGEPDGGWELSARDQAQLDDIIRPNEFEAADQLERARAALGSEPEVLETVETDETEFSWESDAAAPILARESGALAPVWEEPEADSDDFSGATEPLTLRPRTQDSDEKRLDWNFGPAAWSDANEEESVARSEDIEPMDEGLDSMRKWAERRDEEHPHFTTAHAESAEVDEAPLPSPIPLRPRTHEQPEAPKTDFMRSNHDAETDFEAPRPLPLVLRSRAEPSPEPTGDTPDGPSKWNEFFNISPAADEDSPEDAGPSEGLGAMRAWAQKKADEEAAARDQIPDEFLKPFDWESDDAPDASPVLREIPADLLKPFAWEEDDSTQEDAVEAPGFSFTEAEVPVVLHEVSEFVPAEPPIHDGMFEDAGEPTAFLPVEPETAASEIPVVVEDKKKPGRFGRMFGRGKSKEKDHGKEPVVVDIDTAGSWTIDTEDEPLEDIRTVAELREWDEDGGTLTAVETAYRESSEGWGGSLTEGHIADDREAISEFAADVTERVATEPESQFGGVERDFGAWTSEAAASAVETQTLDLADQDDGWNPEPVVDRVDADSAQVESTWEPDPTVASVEAIASVEDVAEPEAPASGWWEAAQQPEVAAPVEAVASVEDVAEPEAPASTWWEAAEQSEVESPVEAVASVEDVVEPEAPASAWWEAAPQSEVEAPVETVASVEDVVEPEAPASAWWEAAEQSELEAPVEAVASVADVVEPETPASAWWEAAEQSEANAPVEAVASVADVVEPETPASPWWEAAPQSEVNAPVEAVASVEDIVEPETPASAWWEAAEQSEVESPVEAVASVEDVVEPEAPASSWWEATEQSEPEIEAPVEAVASVEDVAEPEAPASPWWEAAPQSEVEAPVEAVASVEDVAEPEAPASAWWEAAEQSEVEAPVEAVASLEDVVDPETPASPWWEAAEQSEPEVEAPVEAVASVEDVVEPEAPASAWWEAAEVEAPVEAVASVEDVAEPEARASSWWETAEPSEVEVPVEAVASVEDVVNPETPASPWWEAAEQSEVEAPVEAVASVEPEAPASAWWEAAEQSEVEAPVEAVASVEDIAEPEAPASPWWEAAEQSEVEAPVEAVASVEEVAEPEAPASAWWEAAEQSEPEIEAPMEAVASVEPEAPASAWWEAAEQSEVESPVEAVASVEPEAPASAWWEAAEQSEVEAPVEAVASVEDIAEPEAPASPWWEAAEQSEVEAPVEAVASVEEVAEPEAPASAWWEAAEQSEPEIEAPMEAVASVADFVEPEAPASAWWEAAEQSEVESPVEAVASVEDVAQPDSAPETDEDDPWADFVNAPAAAVVDTAPAAASGGPWAQAPATMPPADDMWGDIASHAEEAAASDPLSLDLAASLESQMAAPPAPQEWPMPEEEVEWSFPEPESSATTYSLADEDDVILAAFERHAAMPESQQVPRESDAIFAELLGHEAEDIVAEADDSQHAPQSFLRPGQWAPQRDSRPLDGGWAEEPEPLESQYRSEQAFGGSDGAGFAPPPWAVDDLERDVEALPQHRSGHRTKTWIRELVETGLLALLVFLSVRASFQNFKVEGSSMFPTLEDGQFLIVNKLVYSEVDMDKLSSYVPFVDPGSDPQRNVFHGPERGDIIVLKDPRNTETDLIKRVIGLPGETIEIVDGRVYINDQLLEEPYIKQTWHDTKQKIAIPPGEFFVMGDNRDNSLDSRSSQVGLVPQDLIIGKAMLSYWPRDKFGFAPNEEGKLGDAKPVLTTKRIGEE